MPRRQRIIARIGLLMGLLCGAGAAPAQQVVPIADDAALRAAVSGGVAGQVLELAPGTYDHITLRQARVPAVIRSADPANPAVLRGLLVDSFQGLTLENLVLAYAFDPEDQIQIRPFMFRNCSDLALLGNRIIGDRARGLGEPDDGHGWGIGLTVRDCDGVRIEGNHISLFRRGLTMRAVSDVTVRGNELTDLRMDGMNFAQVADVRIEGNLIHNFDRVLVRRDHADMIQFWTARTDEPTRDIVIRGNILNSGAGLFTQSIFMRNEIVDTGRAGEEMFYRNITIEDNLILNAHAHGITVGETDRLRIRGNTIIQNRASVGGDPGRMLYTPHMRINRHSHDVEITGNITHRIMGYEDQPDWDVSGNLLVQNNSRLGGSGTHYSLVFDNGGTPEVPGDVSSWRLIPGGPGDRPGLGTSILRP